MKTREGDWSRPICLRGQHEDLARISLGRGASGILILPARTRAYVALTGANTVAVIDLAALSVVERLNTGVGPDGMAWLPPR